MQESVNVNVTVQTPPCMICNESSTFELPATLVLRWRKGELIQRLFPEMPQEDRETLISGTHAKCWDTMFDGAEDE